MAESYRCRQFPPVCWWPELEIEGRTVYDMVLVGEDDRSDWFLLERGGESRNPSWVRSRMRIIEVARDHGPDDIRRQALEWLERDCDTARARRLREDLRRWKRGEGRCEEGRLARQARRRALRLRR